MNYPTGKCWKNSRPSSIAHSLRNMFLWIFSVFWHSLSLSIHIQSPSTATENWNFAEKQTLKQFCEKKTKKERRKLKTHLFFASSPTSQESEYILNVSICIFICILFYSVLCLTVQVNWEDRDRDRERKRKKEDIIPSKRNEMKWNEPKWNIRKMGKRKSKSKLNF